MITAGAADQTYARRVAMTRASMPRLVAEAIAAGTHSAGVHLICDGCRRWCDGYAHITFDRKKLGACCAPKPTGGAHA